jgi:hypothetical protein
VQVDIFILYVGYIKKYDASSASGYITVVQNVKCSIGLLSTSLNATVPKQAALEALILIVGHSLRCIALESQGVRIIRSSLTSQTPAM